MPAVHRIDPTLFNIPQMYGSAGEPSLLSMPSIGSYQGGPRSMHSGGSMAPLLALLGGGLGGLLSGNAQAPDMPPAPQPEPQWNDEPLDIMPDNMKFGDAFAKARKMGLQVFTWRGKPYTTKLK